MFPSNGKQTSMANGEVEVGLKEKKERNCKDEERESYSLICLREVPYEDCINMAKMGITRSKFEGTSPVTKKNLPRLFLQSVYYAHE